MSELPVLEPDDQRVLGSLLEKQTTVPGSYPLTANALRSACNQTNNREPVVDFDQQTVVSAQIEALEILAVAHLGDIETEAEEMLALPVRTGRSTSPAKR